MKMKKIIGITMGDAAGIGPEVVIKALNSRQVRNIADFLVIGDENVLKLTAKKLRMSISGIGIWPVGSGLEPEKIKPGRINRQTSAAAVAYIKEAVRLASTGAIDAIVTAPINKEGINKAGFKYPGHTEMLAELTGTKNFAMMLAGGKIRAVLVTRHIPVREISRKLKTGNILNAIRITDAGLKQYFNCRKPRIAVAGLNPHAGDGGVIGFEEKKIILPAVKLARRQGINAKGPVSPDIVFRQANSGVYDAVVCMYHDQGLIPLKLLAFEKGINVTLGLPFLRSSPDHGTAFDIAGKGVANPESMIEAVKFASGKIQ